MSSSQNKIGSIMSLTISSTSSAVSSTQQGYEQKGQTFFKILQLIDLFQSTIIKFIIIFLFLIFVWVEGYFTRLCPCLRRPQQQQQNLPSFWHNLPATPTQQQRHQQQRSHPHQGPSAPTMQIQNNLSSHSVLHSNTNQATSSPPPPAYAQGAHQAVNGKQVENEQEVENGQQVLNDQQVLNGQQLL